MWSWMEEGVDGVGGLGQGVRDIGRGHVRIQDMSHEAGPGAAPRPAPRNEAEELVRVGVGRPVGDVGEGDDEAADGGPRVLEPEGVAGCGVDVELALGGREHFVARPGPHHLPSAVRLERRRVKGVLTCRMVSRMMLSPVSEWTSMEPM